MQALLFSISEMRRGTQIRNGLRDLSILMVGVGQKIF